jgi:methanogen homocitrate synthase
MKKEIYYKENAWWTSPYNENPEVNGSFQIPHKVEIHDATLRDGEQTPGVVFSVDDKIRIAEKLDEVGIERIEAGMPAVSASDYEAIKAISKRNLKAKIYSFARALRVDIDKAVDCGCHGVLIEVPIGYPKLKYQFNWTWENVLEKSVDSINYAKSQGLYTVLFPYDTTRARDEDLNQLVKGVMQNSPPDAIGIVDTMGCALPQTIEYLVRKMKSLTGGISVEVHTHNDFGMAVATELAGVAAGADVIHSCVNGLGERTGNAAAEELMVALQLLMGVDNHYKLDKIMELCKLVESISGVPIAANKPISGERNYTRESGIGVDLVIKEPLAMFATDPKYFGRTGDIVLGKKSGKLSVLYYLDQLNIQASDDEVNVILNEVKGKGEKKRGLLTVDEFKAIVNSSMQK